MNITTPFLSQQPADHQLKPQVINHTTICFMNTIFNQHIVDTINQINNLEQLKTYIQWLCFEEQQGRLSFTDREDFQIEQAVFSAKERCEK